MTKKLVNIREIKPNTDNPRIIKDHKFKKLVKSIKDFPEMLEKRPIVVDENMIVLGGNMRLKALLEAGVKDVWIDVAEGWTDEQKKEFIIKDNVGFGEWDWDILANEWEPDLLEDWGLDLPDMFEEEPEATEDDYQEPDDLRVDIVKGDLIEIGEHRLLCGDSTNSDDVAKLMNGEKADMVFTDPPYGVSYEGGHNNKKRKGIENDKLSGDSLSNLFTDSLNTACIFTSDKSPFYIWYASGKSKETYLGLSKTDLEVRAVICWYKIKSGLGAFMAQYIPNYEPCIYAHKKGKSINWYGASDEKTVWELKKESENKLHPTQKPVPLAERAIKNSSKLNDIIYDCFLGGGTTMVAAHQLKRKCFGMELDPKYCQVIIDRMQKLDPNLEIKINGQIYGQN
jgi:site-specific DNA-methyltransferase (adenine-specific)